MEVINIPESFVNFPGDAETNTNCSDAPASCYPMAELDDLKFQILLGNFEGTEVDEIISGAITFRLALSQDCEDCEPGSEQTIIATLHMEQWKVDAYADDQYDYFVGSVDTWSDSSTFNALNEGECFHFCLYKVIQVEGPSPTFEYTLLGCSECFKKDSDLCDTSVLKSHQNENSFGFYNNGQSFYDTYYNSIRLPFKGGKPQPKTKKNVYQKSDGGFIKNSATKQMEYSFETDLISEVWHKKLDLALDCDVIFITNHNAGLVNQGFMSIDDDNYKIDWPEFLDYPKAKAEFKLLQNPYYEFNNNCNVGGRSGCPPVLIFSGIDAGNAATIYTNSIVGIP